MKTQKVSRVSMSVFDAAELIGAYDDWAGSLHPDEREEYLSRFNSLRNRIIRLMEDNQTAQEAKQ